MLHEHSRFSGITAIVQSDAQPAVPPLLLIDCVTYWSPCLTWPSVLKLLLLLLLPLLLHGMWFVQPQAWLARQKGRTHVQAVRAGGGCQRLEVVPSEGVASIRGRNV